MKDKLRNAIDNQDGICFFGTKEEKEALVSDIYALIEQERIEIAINLRREWEAQGTISGAEFGNHCSICESWAREYEELDSRYQDMETELVGYKFGGRKQVEVTDLQLALLICKIEVNDWENCPEGIKELHITHFKNHAKEILQLLKQKNDFQ